MICEKDPRSRDIPNIDRQKYLVPDDLSVANFTATRNGSTLTLPAYQAAFMQVA